MRGPEWLVFGTECSHRIWHAPPITSRSPDAGARLRDRPPTARAERQDRDARVGEVAQLSIGVPGDAVIAVAVVVARGAGKSHAEPGFELRADLGERRVGKRRAARVPARETRIVDHTVVHVAPVLLPVDAFDERVEHCVGAEQPAARHVDPRLVVEGDALEPRRLADLRLATSEERSLQHPHAASG